MKENETGMISVQGGTSLWTIWNVSLPLIVEYLASFIQEKQICEQVIHKIIMLMDAFN